MHASPQRGKGDQDHAAPPAVQAAYRSVPSRMKNVRGCAAKICGNIKIE